MMRDTKTRIGCIGPDGHLWGHVWLELGGDLIDFSTGDWAIRSTMFWQMMGEIPPLWEVQPPSYVWRPKATLARWKSRGFPHKGDIWYGPWRGPKPDDVESLLDADTVHFYRSWIPARVRSELQRG